MPSRARNAHGPGAWVNSPAGNAGAYAGGVRRQRHRRNAEAVQPRRRVALQVHDYRPRRTCASVAANTASTKVTGLTPLTAYTFTAYPRQRLRHLAGSGIGLHHRAAWSVSNLGESGTSPSFLTLTQRWATAFTTRLQLVGLHTAQRHHATLSECIGPAP